MAARSFFPDSACPAGFRVRINFSAPTGTECEGIPSCFNEDNVFGVNVDDCPECLDTSLPRSAPCPPPDDPRGKGFWKRVCKKHHPSGERENLPDYVAFVNATDTFFHVENARGICSELHPKLPKDKCKDKKGRKKKKCLERLHDTHNARMCEKAEAAFMALLLNVASGRLAECNCVDDPALGGERTVGDAIAMIDGLIKTGLFEDCLRALEIAEAINSDLSLCP